MSSKQAALLDIVKTKTITVTNEAIFCTLCLYSIFHWLWVSLDLLVTWSGLLFFHWRVNISSLLILSMRLTTSWFI